MSRLEKIEEIVIFIKEARDIKKDAKGEAKKWLRGCYDERSGIAIPMDRLDKVGGEITDRLNEIDIPGDLKEEIYEEYNNIVDEVESIWTSIDTLRHGYSTHDEEMVDRGKVHIRDNI